MIGIRINKEVIRWGQALLESDEERIGAVEAVGVDETMFCRTAPRRRPRRQWCTSMHAKETLRDVYQIRDPGLADEYTRRLAADLQDQSCPPEVNQLSRAIARWYTQNCGPASAPGCQTDPPKQSTISPERIKRIGFGFRNFTNYRIRALLYAGKPNWDLLPTLTLP